MSATRIASRFLLALRGMKRRRNFNGLRERTHNQALDTIKKRRRSLFLENLESREVFAAFTPGNLVILQLVTSGLTNGANATSGAFIELTTAGGTPSGGSNVIPIPTQATANAGGATFSGSATSAPGLSISGNGQLLTTIGYDAPLDSSVPGSAATFNRNVVQVDANGIVSIPLRLNNALTNNTARDAVTNDGTGYWVAGQPGIQYATPSATPKAIDGTIATTNNRDIAIVGGNLIADTATALTRFAGLPTTTSTGTSLGLALSNAYAYQFLDRAAGVGDTNLGGSVDTLYVANDNATNTIAKYSFNGTTWVSQGLAALSSQSLFGLVGRVNGSNAELFATTNTQSSSSLRSFTDTAAYNATISGAFTTLSTAPANTFYRGISFAPVAPAVAPSITTDPSSATITYGANATFSAAATGTPTPTVQWQVSIDNGTNWTDITTTTDGSIYTGFTANTLTVTKPGVALSNRQYRAVYTNSAGNVNTNAATLTVNQKAASVTANNITKSQGATLTNGSGSTAFSSSGLVLGETIDTVTITYGAGAAAADPAGTYVGSVVASLPIGSTFTAANYNITFTPGDIIVSADPTISTDGALSAVNTTYGTASPTPTSFSVSGGFLTGNLTVTAPTGFEISMSSSSGYASSLILAQSSGTVSSTTIFVRLPAAQAAGTYSGNITISGGGATSVNVPTVSSTVATKNLTISGLNAIGKEYDGGTTAIVAGTPTYVGLENGESFSVTPIVTWSYATKTVGTAKPLSSSAPFTAPSTNYTVTQPSLSADITAKALTVSGAAVSNKVFDNTTTATIIGASLLGVIAPDVVSINSSVGNFADVNVGTAKPVTAAITITGTDSGNYTVTQPTGLSADITQASQSITFNSLPTVTTAVTTVTLPSSSSAGLPISYTSSNPLVATVSGNILTIVGVGTSTITASQAGNSNVAAAASVQQSQTVVAAPITWNFGTTTGNAAAAAVPANLTASVVSQGNSFGATTMLSSSSPSNNTGASGQFNAGIAAKAGALDTTATTGSAYFEFTITPAATYQVSVSSIGFGSRSTGTGPSNYAIRSSANNFTTNLATGTIPTNSNWASYQPTISTVTSATPITFRIYGFGSTGTPSSGTVTWRIDDLQLTATADPIPLANPTISITSVDKVYDGTVYVATASISGSNAPTPTLSFTYFADAAGTTQIAAPTNSGTYYVQASSAANSGNNAAQSGITAFSITQAPLTISGVTANNKVYDGTNSATLIGTPSYVGLVPGETFSVNGTPIATFAQTNVGTGIGVSVTGYAAPSSNYTVTQPSLSANITTKVLTITADAKSKFVGQADPPLTYTPSGLLSGDSITGSLTRELGEAVGTYAILQGTIGAGSNYSITFVGANFTINAAAAAPTLTSVVVNGADSFLNNAQRSMVTSLVVTFSSPVTLAAGAFSITNIGLFTVSNLSLDSSQILVSANATNNIYTIRFGTGNSVNTRQGTGPLGNSLADGNYRLTIDPAKVTGSGGTLSGNNVFGAAAVDNFFRMYSDSNGDGVVNAIDRAAVMSALSGTLNAALDFDGNGSTTTGVDTSNYFANNNKRRRLF